MTDNLLQATALALLLYGSWQAGSLRLRAYAAKLLGSFAQIGVGLWHHVWGIWAIGAVLAVMQIRAIINWRRKGVPF